MHSDSGKFIDIKGFYTCQSAYVKKNCGLYYTTTEKREKQGGKVATQGSKLDFTTRHYSSHGFE